MRTEGGLQIETGKRLNIQVGSNSDISRSRTRDSDDCIFSPAFFTLSYAWDRRTTIEAFTNHYIQFAYHNSDPSKLYMYDDEAGSRTSMFEPAVRTEGIQNVNGAIAHRNGIFR